METHPEDTQSVSLSNVQKQPLKRIENKITSLQHFYTSSMSVPDIQRTTSVLGVGVKLRTLKFQCMEHCLPQTSSSVLSQAFKYLPYVAQPQMSISNPSQTSFMWAFRGASEMMDMVACLWVFTMVKGENMAKWFMWIIISLRISHYNLK